MFQWLQKLVPLKHLSSEHMIYVQKSKELEFLKDTFIANDIPINIVDRIFQKYIPQKYRTDQWIKKTQKTPIEKGNFKKKVFTLFSAKGQLLKRNFANLHQRSQLRNQSTIFTANTAPNVVQHTLGNAV